MANPEPSVITVSLLPLKVEEVQKMLKSSKPSNHSPEFHKAKAGESISEREWEGSGVDILSMSSHPQLVAELGQKFTVPFILCSYS